MEKDSKSKQKQLEIKKEISLKFKSLKPNFKQQLTMKNAIREDELNKVARMKLTELKNIFNRCLIEKIWFIKQENLW